MRVFQLVHWVFYRYLFGAGLQYEEQTGQVPGDFNMYILALSWKAEWCHASESPGCTKPHAYWKNHMTLHGLWPDYGDGSYPTLCTDEPFDEEKVLEAVGRDVMLQYWPNVNAKEDSSRYASFWEHEWTKHGTCTGLTQVDYFRTALLLLEHQPDPDSIIKHIGEEVPKKDVESDFGGKGMVVLDCKGGRYLNQVYLCYAVDETSHVPKERIPCPAAVIEHDYTCSADGLLIDTWGG